jgi:hypothetical protein
METSKNHCLTDVTAAELSTVEGGRTAQALNGATGAFIGASIGLWFGGFIGGGVGAAIGGFIGGLFDWIVGR